MCVYVCVYIYIYIYIITYHIISYHIISYNTTSHSITICLILYTSIDTVPAPPVSQAGRSQRTVKIYTRNLLGWLRLGWLKIHSNYIANAQESATCMYISLYIYLCLSLSLSIYIYIYIYIT